MAVAPGNPPDALILDLWEKGASASPLERALLLLAHARPELDPDDRLAMPLGLRDRAIAALRAHLFGPGAELVAQCPACGENAEIAIPDMVGMLARAAIAEAPRSDLGLRPVTTGDLMAAATAAAEGRDPRAVLVVRLMSLPDGAAAPALRPADLEAALEALDPAAEIRLDLACPDCGHQWTAVLDIADCTWREVTVAAGRVADEVATLAAAYGWREADTLAMSRARRALYLERAPR